MPSMQRQLNITQEAILIRSVLFEVGALGRFGNKDRLLFVLTMFFIGRVAILILLSLDLFITKDFM